MSDHRNDELRSQVYDRAAGLCECSMIACKRHGERCKAILKGHDWKVHRVSADKPFDLGNALALCIPCSRNNPTLRG